eukprot:2184-Heterococcus_DN1.PRE.6
MLRQTRAVAKSCTLSCTSTSALSISFSVALTDCHYLQKSRVALVVQYAAVLASSDSRSSSCYDTLYYVVQAQLESCCFSSVACSTALLALSVAAMRAVALRAALCISCSAELPSRTGILAA